MPHPTTTPDQAPHGWRVFRSNTGRFWATREVPFTAAEGKANAWRTDDGDDELELARAMAEQESRAALAARPRPFAELMGDVVAGQLRALSHTHPGWVITRPVSPDGVPGQWRATRVLPLTQTQSASGLVSTIQDADATVLVTALAAQDAIEHPTRYTTGRAEA